MCLRGALAGPERIIPLGPSPGPYLSLEGDRVVDADALLRLLKASTSEVPMGIQLRVEKEYGSLSLWLALEDSDSCTLGILAESSVVDRSDVPLLIEYSTGDRKQRAALTLLGERGLVALARPPNGPLDSTGPVPLSMVAFGEASELVARMRGHLAAWDRAGRPKTESLRIRAYPKPHQDLQEVAGSIVDKRWTTIVISQA